MRRSMRHEASSSSGSGHAGVAAKEVVTLVGDHNGWESAQEEIIPAEEVHEMSDVVEIRVNDDIFRHELAAAAYEISVDEVSKVMIGVV